MCLTKCYQKLRFLFCFFCGSCDSIKSWTRTVKITEFLLSKGLLMILFSCWIDWMDVCCRSWIVCLCLLVDVYCNVLCILFFVLDGFMLKKLFCLWWLVELERCLPCLWLSSFLYVSAFIS